jgi:peptidoglycan/LPS O-acetylase OafA/YrhL
MVVPHLAISDKSSSFFNSLPVITDALGCLMWLHVFIRHNAGHSLASRIYNLNVEAPIVALQLWGFCFGPELSPLGNFFSHPIMVKLGELGYGVYLFHMPVLLLLFKSGIKEYWIAISTTFAVAVLMSWAMYVILEVPVQTYARRVINNQAIVEEKESAGSTSISIGGEQKK